MLPLFHDGELPVWVLPTMPELETERGIETRPFQRRGAHLLAELIVDDAVLEGVAQKHGLFPGLSPLDGQPLTHDYG